MDNFERGDQAERLVAVYMDGKGGGETNAADVLSDMITDILHLAQRDEIDVEDLIVRSAKHYGADCIEQAWENSDDWAQEMQSPLNIEKAVTVLNACGVPELFHHGCLVYVGLLRPDEF